MRHVKHIVHRTIAVFLGALTFFSVPISSLDVHASSDGTLAEVHTFSNAGLNTFGVDKTGTYTVELWGGAGGDSGTNGASDGSAIGGKGGYVKITLDLTVGDNLYMYVGARGDALGNSGFVPGNSNGTTSGGGGGIGGRVGSGGGATEIRLNGQGRNNIVAVAGGGGGAALHPDTGAKIHGMDAGIFTSGNNGDMTGKGSGAGSYGAGGGGGYIGGSSGSTSAGAHGGSNHVSNGIMTNRNETASMMSAGYVVITRLSSYIAKIDPNGGTYDGYEEPVTHTLDTTYTFTRTFGFAGYSQSMYVEKSGYYYMELWGGAGGQDASRGGYGGYLKTYVYLNAGQTIYVTTGGAGISQNGDGYSTTYNGGAAAGHTGSSGNYSGTGGGATSVTLTNRGELMNFAGHKGEVIAVAGGGAGGSAQSSGAGGSVLFIGNAGNYYGTLIQGSTNLLNGSFGWGSNPGSNDGGGGGGGWVGGVSGLDDAGHSAGGGASYANTSYCQPIGLAADNNSGYGMARISYMTDMIGLNNPIRPGYRFDGWEKVSGNGILQKNSLSNLYMFTYKEGTTIVQAKWTPLPGYYNLTIQPNGGSYIGSVKDARVAQTQNTTYAMQTPVRYGYDFIGWTLQSGSGGSYVGNVYTFGASDAVIKANWKKHIGNLTIDTDGGLYNTTQSATSDTVTFTGSPMHIYHNLEFGSSIKVNGPFKYGYTFDYWTETNGSDGFLDENKYWHSAVIDGYLKARWTENDYTIRYDKNTPARASSVISGNMTDSSNLMWTGTYNLHNNNYALTGWTFKGWSLSPGAANTVDYANNASICNKTDAKLVDNPDGVVITLYAVWQENKYNVVFNGNNDTGYVTGNTSMMSNVLYEDFVNLTSNGYKRTSPVNMEYKDGQWRAVESKFLGWNYNVADKQHVVFADKALVSKLSTTDNSTVRLFAVWDDNPTFEIGGGFDPDANDPNQNFEVEFPDRYFSLTEAQNGIITEQELLSQLTASDREDDSFIIELVGFEPSDYTSLTSPSVFSQTYKVTDYLGQFSYMTVNVYVLEDDNVDADKLDVLRSYDDSYYIYEDGTFVSSEDGGIGSNSLWLTDGVYNAFLSQVVLDRGTDDNKVYGFSSDDLTNIRNYVLEHGIGNNDNGNLAHAYLTYIKDNIRVDE